MKSKALRWYSDKCGATSLLTALDGADYQPGDSELCVFCDDPQCTARVYRAPGSRSGPNLTDAQRAKLGYGRLTLRLPEATLRQLEQLAKARRSARVTVLCDLINDAAQAKR